MFLLAQDMLGWICGRQTCCYVLCKGAAHASYYIAVVRRCMLPGPHALGMAGEWQQPDTLRCSAKTGQSSAAEHVSSTCSTISVM